MSLAPLTRRLLTILDYLPGPEEWVRVWIKGNRRGSFLAQVKELAAIASKNPGRKITVSFAAFMGGQEARHVIRVTAIAIDLDASKTGFASREQIALLQNRFPAAALVISNGVTLLYLIPHGATWREMVSYAVAVGQEAERITGLHLDAKTLVRGDGTPAAHEGHLFRFAGGYAERRQSPVEFVSPTNPDLGVVEDAAGLVIDYTRLASKTVKSKNRNAEHTGGSLDEQRAECSQLLSIRRRVLAEGGTVADAVAVAAAETGLQPARIEALYIRPGYEPLAIKKRASKRFKDNTDQGIVGVESSSRRYQQTKSWWANFGHSIQAAWDMGWGVDVAYELVVTDRDFRWFLAKFKEEHGAAWPQVLRKDLETLYAKFGTRGGLKTVSVICKEKVLDALGGGCVNAPQIARKIGYTDRHVKRALASLKAEGKVEERGKNKGKVWSRISGHTDRIGSKEESKEEKQYDVALVPFPTRSKVQLLQAHRRSWRRPVGCPVTTKEQKAKWKQENEKIDKNEATRKEIRFQGFMLEVEQWWSNHPGEFRQLKSRWGYEWQQFKRGFIETPPDDFHQYATNSYRVAAKTEAVMRKRAASRAGTASTTPKSRSY